MLPTGLEETTFSTFDPSDLVKVAPRRFTRNRRKRAERMRKIAVETRARRYTSKPRARVESAFSLRYKSAERTGTTYLMACVCQCKKQAEKEGESRKKRCTRTLHCTAVAEARQEFR